MQLVVLGKYDPNHAYQRAVKEAASDEVRFIGAVYDKPTVAALRFHAQLYVHGHQVGGTNPSLVESLGAGNAVLAHDNPFNRWVVADGARYFKNEDECAAALDNLLDNEAEIASMKAASRSRFDAEFTWEKILKEYEDLLLKWI
jgi:glycosyltransferase involved in cell wall biosynthesis